MSKIIIRAFDVLISIVGLVVFFPFMFIVFLVLITESKKPLFTQIRVGKNKKPFTLIKFRTMKPSSPEIATHLSNAQDITKFGKFLRAAKVDELPQLWNVLVGDMSLVGPRPNLFNQYELIKERDNRHLYKFKPGITGLAQIKNIDMSTPIVLAKTDAQMMANLSIMSYFAYIFMTVLGRGYGDAVGR